MAQLELQGQSTTERPAWAQTILDTMTREKPPFPRPGLLGRKRYRTELEHYHRDADHAEESYAQAYRDYAQNAYRDWFQQRPEAPDWQLPIYRELRTPSDLGRHPDLGGSAGVRVREISEQIEDLRTHAQPPMVTRGGHFPGSSEVRGKPGDLVPDGLDPTEQSAFDAWFRGYEHWHEWPDDRRADLQAICDQPLAVPSLVYRQHKIRIVLDGCDLAMAHSGTVFTLPYPAACRRFPQPLYNIRRNLPKRASYANRDRDLPERIVYLEIWASRGRPMPPSGDRNEAEVLLPHGSRFEVIRHVDLPYYAALTDGGPIEYTHGVQILQLDDQ